MSENCIKEAEDLLVNVMDGVIDVHSFGFEMVRVLPELLNYIENNITEEKETLSSGYIPAVEPRDGAEMIYENVKYKFNSKDNTWYIIGNVI